MSTLIFSSSNFDEEVIKSSNTVLVDFYATWCGPCKMMAPIIDKVAEELEGTVKVGKVNVDENMELAQSFGIMSIPTIMIFKNGEVVKKFLGVTDKTELLEALK